MEFSLLQEVAIASIPRNVGISRKANIRHPYIFHNGKISQSTELAMF
jgi:hypothetical protein